MTRLGVAQALVRAQADGWSEQPLPLETQRLLALRLSLAQRASVGNAASNHRAVAGSLAWLESLASWMPSRHLFIANDLDYNANTFALLAEFMRDSGSRATGTRKATAITAKHISGSISTLKAYLARVANAAVAPSATGPELAAALKQMRQEDGPAGQRAVDNPLRAKTIRLAYSRALDRTSTAGRVRHAAVLFGHNVLARGADIGHVSRKQPIDGARDLTIAAFDWAAGERMVPPAVIVWLFPSKDTQRSKKRFPMLIQRRSGTAASGAEPASAYERGADAMCTYDALALAWPILAGSVPPSAHATTMFFRWPEAGKPAALWRPVVSDDVGRWGREVAVGAGVDTVGIGDRCLRMGGASDMYDLYGPAGERLIRERGRWGTDIAQIYQRVSASEHGSISRAIGDADGDDLQSMLRGWSQLAVSHGRPR